MPALRLSSDCGPGDDEEETSGADNPQPLPARYCPLRPSSRRGACCIPPLATSQSSSASGWLECRRAPLAQRTRMVPRAGLALLGN